MTARVILYTRAFCGYCTAAEQLLKSKGVDYEHEDVTGDQSRRRWLAQVTGRTTVPQIFINGKAIGGFTDLRDLDRSGELDRMLAEAPPDA
jgi:glutaredoxin 3